MRHYNRPVTFTGERFTYWDDNIDVHALLDKQDDDLTAGDYCIIFRPNAQPGTYEETAYFIPRVLNFMTHNVEASHRCIEYAVRFFSRNMSQLHNDNTIKYVMRSIQELFKTWTATFDVVHLDRAAMMRMKSERAYGDYVIGGRSVGSLIQVLSEDDNWCEVLNGSIHDLITRRDKYGHAWSIEIARQIHAEECQVHIKSVRDLLTSMERFTEHVAGLGDTIGQVFPETYWQDVLRVMHDCPAGAKTPPRINE